LIQYLSPQGEKTVRTRRCDAGSAQNGFTVDNAFTVFKRFKKGGVHVVSEPVKDSRGNFMFYLYDPDGYTLEITDSKRKGVRWKP
jgi:YD repeat-containing protein